MKTKSKTVVEILFFAALLFCVVSAGCAEKHSGLPDYTFTAGGADIAVGDDIDSIAANAGKCNGFSSTPSCAGDGAAEMYVYNGYRIFVFRAGDTCRITSIELTNDTVRTREGIRIGDSRSAVIAAYGESYSLSGNRMIYRGKNATLQFFLNDGKVLSIKYLENGDQR